MGAGRHCGRHRHCYMNAIDDRRCSIRGYPGRQCGAVVLGLTIVDAVSSTPGLTLRLRHACFSETTTPQASLRVSCGRRRRAKGCKVTGTARSHVRCH
eukprot:3613769-Rhodomonas_salina.1